MQSACINLVKGSQASFRAKNVRNYSLIEHFAEIAKPTRLTQSGPSEIFLYGRDRIDLQVFAIEIISRKALACSAVCRSKSFHRTNGTMAQATCAL